MAEGVTSTTEPNYILRLALQSAPFNDNIEQSAFFSSGQSGHRLNLILHLLHSDNKLASLVAEKGLGKTTLLNQLPLQTGDEIKLCQLDGKQHPNSTTILAKCLVDLGVNNNEIVESAQPTEILKNRLYQLQKINIKVILLIDNAEQLNFSTWSEISDWLSWQNDQQFLLGAVFASTKPLTLTDDMQGRLQEIDLPAMDASEIAAYLLHRLRAVGLKQGLPFSEQEIKRIHQLSSGRPIDVNRLAHQQLMGLHSLSTPSAFRTVIQGASRWAGIIIITICVITLMLFQETINTWLDSDMEHDGEFEIIELKENELTQVEAGGIQYADDLIQRQELENLLAELPDDEKIEPDVQAEKLAATERIPVIETTAQEVYGEKWILQQGETNYTFQLIGSWDKEEVNNFIDKYALTGDVAVFESLRNGRSWYALVFGRYDDKQAALAASKQWPAPLNTLPSWLRRFDSVQDQIKNNAVMQR